jgi:hypothetical protein
MATIIKSIDIDASAADVWDAVADVQAVHRRFAPGLDAGLAAAKEVLGRVPA